MHIKQSRTNAIKAVNTELIGLYWAIGEYIYKRVESAEWGESVVKELAWYLQRTEPDLKGFSDKNLWRMKQFFEAYSAFPKLSTLSREISWSHNLAIFSRCKTAIEREFCHCFDSSCPTKEESHQTCSPICDSSYLGRTKKNTSLQSRALKKCSVNIFSAT